MKGPLSLAFTVLQHQRNLQFQLDSTRICKTSRSVLLILGTVADKTLYNTMIPYRTCTELFKPTNNVAEKCKIANIFNKDVQDLGSPNTGLPSRENIIREVKVEGYPCPLFMATLIGVGKYRIKYRIIV